MKLRTNREATIQPNSGFRIRPFEPRDEEAVYEVCLKTGDAGLDATRLYSDPRMLGRVFVGPYLRFETQFVFVLEDALGVCGYVLGTLDSARFYQAFLEQWLPQLRIEYPAPTAVPASWTPTQRLCHQCHHPEVYFPESFRAYPSQLHIDLLPRAQGRGLGGRMVSLLLDRLRSQNSPGVHLGLESRNLRAQSFFRKMGFSELARQPAGTQQTLYLGRQFSFRPGSPSSRQETT